MSVAERLKSITGVKTATVTLGKEGIFYEAVTNKIIDDLVAACEPRWMRVCGEFSARGGITTTVTVEYGLDKV